MSRTNLIPLMLLAGLAACATRNAPATQNTAKVFDAAASDPKAMAIADQVVAALGGEANWHKAKELAWTQGIVIDGALQDVGDHAWDRWNGRHQYKKLFSDGGKGVVMHELFSDTSYAYVQTASGRFPQMKSDKEKMVKEAQRRFDIDAYFLALPFKLKDPGVKLKFSEERQAEGAKADAPMKFDVIQLTFDQGVGPIPGDTWYVVVDKETHIPEMIEHVAAGKPDTERGGFKLDDWQEAGGLKFATRRTTLGYTKLDGPKVKLQLPAEWVGVVPFQPVDVPSPGEIVLINGVLVSESPNDDLYVPNVNQ